MLDDGCVPPGASASTGTVITKCNITRLSSDGRCAMSSLKAYFGLYRNYFDHFHMNIITQHIALRIDQHIGAEPIGLHSIESIFKSYFLYEIAAL